MIHSLITICARGGSKGVPGKNIRDFMGLPLIGHTIRQAQEWSSYARNHYQIESQIVVSTDSSEIADVARTFGAGVPFLRPLELASDNAGKVPVITHALASCEKQAAQPYDFVLDLDPTSPVRTCLDLELGWKKFSESASDVVLSVVKARKSPYFNVLERDESGKVKLVKPLDTVRLSRQAAPQVWDANASIYFYRAGFLRSNPTSIWGGSLEIFEMPPESSFDIDEERDFLVAEAMMKWSQNKMKGTSK